jgi:predicted porin
MRLDPYIELGTRYQGNARTRDVVIPLPPRRQYLARHTPKLFGRLWPLFTLQSVIHHMRNQPRTYTSCITALALASVGASVYAQSSVNVYGLIDVAIVKESKASTAMGLGYPNWLGVMGSEDLGNGTAATFNLMTRFMTDSGSAESSSTFWYGESTVGLKNTSTGHLRLGRALTPMWALKYQFEPWGDSWYTGSLGKYQATGRFFADPSTCVSDCPGFARVSNAVFYDSPTVAGFDLHLSTQAEKGANAARRSSGASLNYGAGDFKGMLSWERNTMDQTAIFMGASYDFGLAKIMGSWGQSRQDGGEKQSSVVLAGSIPLAGQNAFRFGHGHNLDTENHKTSSGLQHFFSKRTQVYADLYVEKTDSTSRGLALGMQHSF